jgi:hypothetical protein
MSLLDPGFATLELRIVVALIVLLTAMCLYLVVAALWIRSANARTNRIREQVKEELYPQVLAYLEDAISADEVIPKSDEKHHTIRLQELEQMLFDYARHLEGEEYEKIQQLLTHRRFMSYHLKQLQSKTDQVRIRACVYYGHLEALPEHVEHRIEAFLQSDNRLLAHAAASAMMSSRNLNIRFRALTVMSSRKVISEMALLDLLYEFHRVELDQAEQETKRIMQLVRNELLPELNVALLIRGLADLNLVFASDPLFNLFQNPKRYDVSGQITEALIRAMTEFYRMDALPRIRSEIYNNSVAVRKACAYAFGEMGQEEDLKALKNLLYDKDYAVRFEAVKALNKLGSDGYLVLAEYLKNDSGDVRRMAEEVMTDLKSANRFAALASGGSA